MTVSRPLKHAVHLNPETLTDATDPGLRFDYIDISSVSGGVVSSTNDEVFETAPSRARRVVREGDVLVSTVRTYLRAIAGVGPDHDGAVASTGFAVLRPRKGLLDSHYLRYACLSNRFVDEVVARSRGVSYPAINASELVSIRIPVPPMTEQRRVADYLDDELEHIDKVIRKNERLLALLEERRTAVCEHILDWSQTRPLKQLTASVTGGEWGDDPGEEDVDVRCYRGADMDRRLHVLEDEPPVRSLTAAQVERKQLMVGDIVLEKSGGGPTTTVGCSALVTEAALRAGPAVCSNFTARVRPAEGVRPEYLQIVMALLHRSARLDAYAKQTTGIQNLDIPNALQMRVPYVDAPAQDAVVQYVTNAWASLENARSVLLGQAHLLSERRQALITEAIDGSSHIVEAA